MSCGGKARLYFTVAIMLLIAVFIGAFYGDSIDSFTNSIIGRGSFEQRTNIHNGFDHALDVASAANGQIMYKSSGTWGDGTKLTFDSEFETEVGDQNIRGIPFSTKYKVGIFSDSMKTRHYLVAYDITGPFVGSGHFVSTELSNEDIIVMDSSRGNATFRGKMLHEDTLSESETTAIGQFVIEQVLNQKKDVNFNLTLDPLGFCAGLDRDMILDQSIPDGTYVVPEGYAIVGGHIVKEGTTVEEAASADTATNIVPTGYSVVDGQILPDDSFVNIDGQLYEVPVGYEMIDGKLYEKGCTKKTGD